MPNEPPPLVSAAAWANTPLEVQTAFLTLVDLVRDLSAQVNDLRAQVKQTSRNSSKPPSSDPPSASPPSLPRTSRGKRAGAQEGHKDQQRPFLTPEQVHHTIICAPDTCSGCGITLSNALPDAAPRLCWQIWEVPALTAQVTEYQCCTLACPACQQMSCGHLPADVPPGAFGPRLTALISRHAWALPREYT